MRKILVISFAAFASFAACASPAVAGVFSSTGPVIAILAGNLFTGEAEGNLDGAGTISIRSRPKPDVTCYGRFTSSAELGGAGNLQCSDGATATIKFQRLSLRRGHGTGSYSRGPMSFTYGLTAIESEPYLKLPVDKSLRLVGQDLMLVDIRQPEAPIIPAKVSIAPALEIAPDVLLSAATLVVTARLKEDLNLQINSPEKIAELVESTILPLFNFRHMTQLAVARNWRLASPEQQDAIVSEFRTLLVRTYSTALANYRDQAIEYRPLRMAPGDTGVTVKSTVKQPGAVRMSIDYDMEKTAAGWKVYDIKIGGISLITTYRSTFARTVSDSGVDGLILSLSAKNREPNSGLRSEKSNARSSLFLYAVIPTISRGITQ
ncbi:MAG: ABC transporter substrate-binding protein [Burkholderiales bacterium]|nr:ABC transporter substrate-binding protein [Burkholderiales bacterium]